MVIENNETYLDLFRFQFTSMANNKNQIYTVYADNDSVLKLFLNQHNFSNYDHCIEYGNFNINRTPEALIEPFKFRSNKFKGTVTVMTTCDFVTNAISDVGTELSSTLVFGTPALRGEIEIFKLISDLIDKLPYAYIIDQYILNDDEYYSYIESNKRDDFDNDYLSFTFDEDSLCESLICASATDDIQPITLEAYVEYFTSILLK